MSSVKNECLPGGPPRDDGPLELQDDMAPSRSPGDMSSAKDKDSVGSLPGDEGPLESQGDKGPDDRSGLDIEGSIWGPPGAQNDAPVGPVEGPNSESLGDDFKNDQAK